MSYQDSLDSISLNDDLELKIKYLGIKKCDCNFFVPNTNQICGCGRPINLHKPEVVEKYNKSKAIEGPYPKEWTISTCTAADDITNGFGEIRFVDSKSSVAKFIRIHFMTEVRDVYDILIENWRLHIPKLLISITGGAKKFKLNANLKNALKKGIVKAALSTDAWLISGGTEEGIMKLVGEAANEMAFTLNPNKKFVLLGIANWSTIKNNNLLTKNPNMVNDYTRLPDVTNEERQYIQKEAALDPNHSHFILVDNSKLNTFEGEIGFRAKLEKYISNFSFDKDLKIPIVVIVADGGPGTAKTCYESIVANSPCLFVEGSGRCADLFAFVYKKVFEKQLEKDAGNVFNIDLGLKAETLQLIKNYFGDKNETVHNEILNQIQKCFVHIDLLSVYSADSNMELDEAILNSLLKARKYGLKGALEQNVMKAQLKLALTWDRIDVAKRFIFNDDDIWKTNSLKDAMYIAISTNRSDFVKEFLDRGFILTKFLTYRCLLKLYNDTPKNSPLFNYLKIKKARDFGQDDSKLKLRFKDIGFVIQDSLRNLYVHEFCRKPFSTVTTDHVDDILRQTDEYGNLDPDILTNKCDVDIDDFIMNPEQHLMIYSVLTSKPKLATIFLKEGRNEIANSLVASKIFQSFARFDDDENLNYMDLSKEFEIMASDILDKAYEINQEDAKMLIIKEIPEIGNATCLQIASISRQRYFISNKCAQDLLVKIWYHKVPPDTSRIFFIMSLILPLIAPLLCNLKDSAKWYKADPNKSQEIHEDEFDEKAKKKRKPFSPLKAFTNYRREVYHFLNAPIVKFIYDKFMYLLLLVLLSYVMLCDFYPIYEHNPITSTDYNVQISILEIILIAWVGSLLLEKIHRISLQESDLIKTKLILFINDLWCFQESVAILIFIVGTILRFIPNERCYKAARIILCIDLIVWYFKHLHSYTVVRTIGPKMVMIRKMLVEMVIFLIVFLAFMFAFGISVMSLGYHNEVLNLNLLENIFFPSFFIIGGNYYTRDTFLFADYCERSDNSSLTTDIYDPNDCPDPLTSHFVLAIYAVYLVFLNILLVNLLIAIFTNTYNEIEKESDQIWKFQRYSLTYEYFYKPILVPPFILLYYIMYLLILLVGAVVLGVCAKESAMYKRFSKSVFYRITLKFKKGFRATFDLKDEIKNLILWESNVFNEYNDIKEKREQDTIENKIAENQDHIDDLTEKTNQIINSREKINKRIEKIYKDIEEICNLIR